MNPDDDGTAGSTLLDKATPASSAPTPFETVTDSPLWRQILFLAWPALAQQGLLLVIQLNDQYLAGAFSPSHQAALTTANYLYWFVTCYAVVVNVGATAMVGRLTGAAEFTSANRAVGQAVLMAAIFGTLGAIVGVLGLPTIVSLLSLEGEAALHTERYLTPLAILLPFYMIEVAGIACLVGAGDTRTGLKVLGGVVALNVPLAWSLSRGIGGVPDFGFVGIAWGTGVSHIVGAGLVLFILARGRQGLKPRVRDLLPDFDLIRRLLRVSLPAALDSLSLGVFQMVFVRIVIQLGETATSAHGIAIRLEALGYLSGAAFGSAAAAVVGRSLGARRPDLARQGGWLALLYGGGVMTVMGAIFFTFARPMFEVFNPNPEQAAVIATGVPVLRLVAFAMPGLAITMVITQVLRAAGDTRVPVLFTWIGFVGVRLPLAYWLTSDAVGFGLFGAWMAMFADIYVRGGLILRRFVGGNWTRVKV